MKIDPQNDPNVQIAQVTGQLILLSSKIENLNDKVGAMLVDLATRLEKQSEMLDKFATKEELHNFMKESAKPLEWARSRQIIEKFIVGVISVLGVAQVCTVILLVFKMASS